MILALIWMFSALILVIFFSSYKCVGGTYTNKYGLYKCVEFNIDGETYYAAKVIAYKLFWIIPVYKFYEGRRPYSVESVYVSVKNTSITLFASKEDLHYTMKKMYKQAHPTIMITNTEDLDARS